MKYHLVLTKQTGERLSKESLSEVKVPRSDLKLLAEELDASLIEQKPEKVKLIDRVRAKLAGTPENWAYARSLASRFTSEDVIFCHGEEIGIPLATILGKQKERPKLVVWFHRIVGLRTRIALKLFNIANLVDLSVVNTRPNQYFLCNYLKLAKEKVLFLRHSIDSSYFAPEISSISKTRPLIVSVGLEQRDYRLLAAATEQLDVDVKVAGFSQFFSRVAETFPEVMPANMTNRKYDLPELLELYHQADAIAVCLKDNSGAAGITALLEAMSCKKPVICVRTQGLTEYLSNLEGVTTIEPGDVTGLQKEILYLLRNSEEAQSQAEKAYQGVKKLHDLDAQVKLLAEFIRTLEK